MSDVNDSRIITAPAWEWHCPYTACWKWSVVELGRDVVHSDVGDWWEVTCPRCKEEDHIDGESDDVARYLPGIGEAS